MFKKTLNRAINYYESFDYICIVDIDGYVEYSAFYNKYGELENEQITGMHILSVYPDLNENESSILQCLKTGKEIFDTLQKIENYNNDQVYLLNTDFPIISKGRTIGVIEVSRELSEKEFIYMTQLDRIQEDKDACISDIKTVDTEFLKIKKKLSKISRSSSPIMIIGETGTGKDLIAEAIHNESLRRHKPFITQNCAAIPATLLESIFFGTVEGAFTDAKDTKGLFEQANHGTLYLDELNSMDLYLQAKILKAVEDQQIRPIGSNKTIKVDVRIICAMNTDPIKQLKKGTLREDLYYRLSVVKIRIPPLRDRRKDIIYLTDYFINYYNNLFNSDIEGISPLVENVLINQQWRGNVRELQNVIEYIFNFKEHGVIQVGDLPSYLYEQKESDIDQNLDIWPMDHNPSFRSPLNEQLDKYEKLAIKAALEHSKTLAQAAKLLKISPQSLQYKLKKHGLNKYD